jgi:hypothetical protein
MRIAYRVGREEDQVVGEDGPPNDCSELYSVSILFFHLRRWNLQSKCQPGPTEPCLFLTFSFFSPTHPRVTYLAKDSSKATVPPSD